jgi:hypothetical protein
MIRRRRRGCVSVEVDVEIDEILDELDVDDLREELARRGTKPLSGQEPEDLHATLREWARDLEAGADPQSVAWRIRQFMWHQLPAITPAKTEGLHS